MGFQLVPKLVTLNGILVVILHYSTKFCSFRGQLCKVVKIDPFCLEQKCSPKNLAFSSTTYGDILKGF